MSINSKPSAAISINRIAREGCEGLEGKEKTDLLDELDLLFKEASREPMHWKLSSGQRVNLDLTRIICKTYEMSAWSVTMNISVDSRSIEETVKQEAQEFLRRYSRSWMSRFRLALVSILGGDRQAVLDESLKRCCRGINHEVSGNIVAAVALRMKSVMENPLFPILNALDRAHKKVETLRGALSSNSPEAFGRPDSHGSNLDR